MNRKILLVIAIVAGLGAALLVKQHIDQLVGDTITVYKATQDTPVGGVLGSGVEPVTLPAGLFPDVLEEAPDENFLDYIKVTPLRARVAAGDILLFRHFDSSVDPGVLPSIPAGKKAISIAVDQASAVSYFIEPGDLVDVMGTFSSLNDPLREAGSDTTPEVSTRPILQAVEVLAVGSEYRPSERQKLEPYGSVTLLVSMDEAAKLIFARDYYSVKLTLILRSKDDTDIASQLPAVGVGTRNFETIGNEPSNKVIIKSGRKSKAVSVLIHIHDIKDQRVGEFRLEHVLSLGNSPDCDIVLDSKYISNEHATFEAEGPQVFVKSLGLNGVMVNDVDVPRGGRMELQPEDVISLPGFVLHITGLRPTRQASDYEMERALSDLKRDIHTELLESANLTGVVMESNDAQMAAEIDEKLTKLLERVSTLADDLLEHIVLKSVCEEAVSTVVRGNLSQSRRRSLDWETSADRIAFDQLVATCLSELGVASNYSGLRIAEVRDGFAEVYQRNSQALSPLQKRYIAREAIRSDILALVYGLGPLEDLMQLPDITEIMVVGKDRIFIEKGGGLEETGRAFPSEDDLNVAVNRMVRPIGRALNRAEPIVDARLDDGSRVHIVIPPVAIHGTAVTIRRFREEPFTLDDLIGFGSLTPQAASFLRACILARKNMVISGGTGSGKTTLLNVLGAQIPADQRLVVIEDSAELQLPQPNQVNLETRKANLEGKGEIPIKSLVRASLRMRPDRIVVGECRSGEALDMLQAMNTGHDGSLTTGHANSPREMIQRLQVMVMEAGEDMPVTAIRQQIAAAVDVIVQIQRQRDRSRKLTHISEVVGYDAEEGEVVMEDIFSLVQLPEGKSELRFTGYLPSFTDDLVQAGETSVEELFAWH